MTKKEAEIQKKLGLTQNLRDSIIGESFTQNSYGPGGCRNFSGLTLMQLEKLVELELIDLEDAQNESPTAGEFLTFMRKFPKVLAHGYCVAAYRDDTRITLEGLRYSGKITKKLAEQFAKFCKNADRLSMEEDSLYAWWD